MVLDEFIEATELDDPKEELALCVPKNFEVLHAVGAPVKTCLIFYSLL